MKRIIFTLCLCAGLTVNAQNILNPDFESHSGGVPDHWMMDNIGADIDLTGGSNGSSALRTWTWYSYVTGVNVNGYKQYDYSSLLGVGTPYTLKPTMLTGVYKYDTSATNSSNDSAMVEVYLKKYNSSLNEVDTVMTGVAHLAPTSGTDFSTFSVPISDLMSGVSPDSLVIVFKSSIGNGLCSGGNCLYLTVDDLALSFGNGIDQPDQKNNLTCFPNPASNVVNIEAVSHKTNIEIYNLSGEMMEQFVLQAGESSFSTQNLSTGIYLIKTIQSTGETRFGKVAIQR